MSLSSVYAEFDLFCVIIMVMITYKTISLSKHLRYQWIYLVMMFFAMTLVASDMLYEFSCSGNLNFSEGCIYLLNIIYFISSLMIAFFWFVYTYSISGLTCKNKKIFWTLVFLPIFILSVISFFTKITRWVFYFDAEGYHRGTLNALYMIIPLVYFVSSCVMALINYLKNKTQKTKEALKTITGFAFFPIASVTFQAIFVGYPAVCLGAALGMLQVFLNSIASDRDELLVAETTSKAKNEFFTKISHEIRTPINAILGMNTMIIRESSENNILDYAKHIDNSCKMLLDLVNDILDISKMDVGKMKIIPAEYDIVVMIKDLVSMIHGMAKEKGIDFQVVIDKDIPKRLYGDEVRIRQTILNLLTNAIKYTDKGSVTFTIKLISVYNEIVKLYVSVEDTGRGLKEEDIKNIFNPYERLDEKKNHSVEGTGLGMSICKNLLSLMNSKLEIESTYGKGSKFYFSVDQNIVDGTPIGNFEITSGADDKKNYESELFAEGIKILAIDDNLTNLKVFKALLKNTGVEIDAAVSGIDGLSFVKKKKYDMIFLDILMPNMDGIETLKYMRSQENNVDHNTPIIAMTANAYEGSKSDYLSKGFNEVITKPIEPRLLEQMIARNIPGNKGYTISWKTPVDI